MAITFITGNKNKFEEVQSILGVPLERKEIDLPEVQSLDAREVIREKLLAAEKYLSGEYIVEDTSLYLGCFHYKLPGPFIKWFEKAIGNEGLADLVEKLGDRSARAVVLIGYINGKKDISFFEGAIDGTIVPPRGEKDFGWGPVFQPNGQPLTFGEIDRSEKHTISMRAIAARKLSEFLAQDKKPRDVPRG
jgi:inosine triphosphate pyrophosphatase